MLTPERLEDAIEALVAGTDHGENLEARRAGLAADLARIEAELKKLVDAVASGAAVQPLLDAIKAREAERVALRAKLADAEALAKAGPAWDRALHRDILRAGLKDWNALLALDPAAGRQQLRALLTSPIVVSRRASGAWDYRVTGVLDRVIRGVLGLRVPASELAWPEEEVEALNSGQAAGSAEPEPGSGSSAIPVCPRGDSNTRHAV